MLTKSQKDAIDAVTATSELGAEYLAAHGPNIGVEFLVAQKLAEHFPREHAEQLFDLWSQHRLDPPLTSAEVEALIARHSCNHVLFEMTYGRPPVVSRAQYRLVDDGAGAKKWEKVAKGTPDHFDQVTKLVDGHYWPKDAACFDKPVPVAEAKAVLGMIETVCDCVARWIDNNDEMVDAVYVGIIPPTQGEPEPLEVKIAVAQEPHVPESSSKGLFIKLEQLCRDAGDQCGNRIGVRGLLSNRCSQIVGAITRGFWFQVDKDGQWDRRYESRQAQAFAKNADLN